MLANAKFLSQKTGFEIRLKAPIGNIPGVSPATTRQGGPLLGTGRIPSVKCSRPSQTSLLSVASCQLAMRRWVIGERDVGLDGRSPAANLGHIYAGVFLPTGKRMWISVPLFPFPHTQTSGSATQARTSVHFAASWTRGASWLCGESIIRCQGISCISL